MARRQHGAADTAWRPLSHPHRASFPRPVWYHSPERSIGSIQEILYYRHIGMAGIVATQVPRSHLKENHPENLSAAQAAC